jgi:hypothetical protein
MSLHLERFILASKYYAEVSVANTLAYYDTELITVAPGVDQWSSLVKARSN